VIQFAESDEAIARCFAVIKQLRPHLEESEFVPTVRRQQREGYRLLYLEPDARVVAVAGFRIFEKLSVGRSLYVDDLVADENERSKGHGAALLGWLIRHAREERCLALELDSGVQRFAAHRFYFANRMVISSHHFALEL